jgi:hypothetical protein
MFLPRAAGLAHVAALLLLPLAALPAAPANSDPVYRSLRDAALGDTLVVENVVLHRDYAVITLKSGTIGFTVPVMARDTVAVFSGEGEFLFTPSLSVEKNHLRNLTGQDTVRETFDRALFTFTDGTGREIRDQLKSRASGARLEETLRDYRKQLRSSPENARTMVEDIVTSSSMDNVEADLLADLMKPGQPGFFSAYLHGRKHSDLRFHVKPRGALPALPSPEEVAVIVTGTEGGEEGIWYLSHLAGELEARKASSSEDKRVVQAQKYRIETTIAKNDHFKGSAELTLRALAAGERVIKLGLLPALRVSRVASDGQETAFIQEGRREDGSFYVILPQALDLGSTHQLSIEYEGDRVVRKEGGGNFSVGARESWYPSVNSFQDHAHYELDFKVPKQYTLVSVGKLVKEWVEQDMACSRWTSETPIAVAGFNYGLFTKKQITDSRSGLQIEGYATQEVPDYLKFPSGVPERGGRGPIQPGEDRPAPLLGNLTPSRLSESAMAQAQLAMRLYETYFGKAPFGRLAITQQPEFNFGQSWPTLIYLPLSAYLDSTQRYALMGGIQSRLTDFVDEVTAHEVAHQWWGHMVSWKTYHDQWLSEGFALFSAGLYLQATEKSPDKYLKYWEHARDELVQKNQLGRRPMDAGPVWMGLRLETGKTQGAYDRVVYRKGGYVLYMLRQLMFDPKEGDKPFIAMMQDFVKQHMNQSASTEDFQRIADRHIRPEMDLERNGKLDWFFLEWVYGTAIPRYKFDYTVTPGSEGNWILKASLTQSEVTPDFAMLVPIYLDFDGQLTRLGTIRLHGNTTLDNIEVKLPKKPKRVLINAFHDVLTQ